MRVHDGSHGRMQRHLPRPLKLKGVLQKHNPLQSQHLNQNVNTSDADR